MNDIEQKALALVNEVLAGKGLSNTPFTSLPTAVSNLVLLRAIEQHEAIEEELHDFRQEVSDAAEKQARDVHEIRCLCSRTHKVSFNTLSQFIIPAPKRDPMTEVWRELFANEYNLYEFIAAMDARGLEIREKNDD